MGRFLLGLAMAQSAAGAALVRAQTPSAPAVRLSGYIQARETYRDDVGLTGSINRARLAASGGGAKDLTWRIQGEFRTGSVGTGRASVSLQDAYVRYRPGSLGIQVGQFKTPFTREFITSLSDIETADRSTVVDSLAPKRDIGVMLDYAFGAEATVFAGVFNGEGQNLTANPDSSLLVVLRATGRPVPYLILGANVADYGGDSTRYGLDASVEYFGAILRGEYILQERDLVAEPGHDRRSQHRLPRRQGEADRRLCVAEGRNSGGPAGDADPPGAGQVPTYERLRRCAPRAISGRARRNTPPSRR